MKTFTWTRGGETQWESDCGGFYILGHFEGSGKARFIALKREVDVNGREMGAPIAYYRDTFEEAIADIPAPDTKEVVG